MPAHFNQRAASGSGQPLTGSHLRVDGVSKSFPDRRVLTNITFTVASGERAALIGENGTGKSTLLRLIAGLEHPDAGSMTHAGDVGLFHQQPPFTPDMTIQQALADAVEPLQALVAAVERAGTEVAEHPDDAEAQRRLEVALAAAEAAQAWEVEHATDVIVDGLGIASLPRDRLAGELSGGQLARLSLAWTLIRRPQTLLLDEPTNHLDDRGAEMLVDTLKGWSGPVLLASHDRAFLDEAVTSLIDLDPAPSLHRETSGQLDAADTGAAFGVTRFTGSYSDYVRAQFDSRDRWEAQYRSEQEELKRLRRAVADNHRVGNPERGPRTEGNGAKKFYADRNAKVVARRVNDARTTLDRLEQEQVRKPPAQLRFRGLVAPESADRSTASPTPILTATRVEVAGRLAPTTLSISDRERLLIEGPNGSGKSTLLRILAGQMAPDAGAITAPQRLRIGLLAQDAVASGDYTARETYARAVGDAAAESTPLSTFGLIAGRDENRRTSSLSVGQRRRLDLAILLAAPPDILLLDEPTNHFSLMLAEDIERALDDYPGAVVIASHDRLLRRRWPHARLSLEPK